LAAPDFIETQTISSINNPFQKDPIAYRDIYLNNECIKMKSTFLIGFSVKAQKNNQEIIK